VVITAKFASVCPKCSLRIAEGARVNWERGQKAAHVACPEISPEDRADMLLDEYDALQAAKGREVAREMAAEGLIKAESDALANLPKGIYRVSLTGAEKVYGTDHVNVQVVPNAKYGNVKFGEWHGESVGTYSVSRGIRYWNDVDPNGARTLAIKAAFAVLIKAADPVEYAKAYAVEASSCWRCGADLVDEQSRARLMGPDCYRQQYGKRA